MNKRDIKFRCWDLTLKRWKVSGSLVRIDFNFIDDDAIYQQYTELKDKNDKKIYEGDILEYDGYEDCTAIVEFDSKFGMFVANGNMCNTRAENFINCEVIGNIYENKELLK